MKKRLAWTLMAFAVAGSGMMSCARVREDRQTAQQPKELTLDCGKGASMKLVLIPAGEFMMGGDEPPEQVAREWNDVEMKAEWFQNEQPQHRVKITKPFHMGAYEVTQAQYKAVMGNNPSLFKGENNPVETVSWNDAAEFCRKLSEKTAQTVRLPMEAEWEYACRAGTATKFSFGDDGGKLFRYGNYCDKSYAGNLPWQDKAHDDGHDKTAPVGRYEPNGWGLYDMHGNVWEWCSDRYGDKYFAKSPSADPQGPDTGQSRVFRGGCWGVNPGGCRSAFRCGIVPGYRNVGIGFRVVCAPRP